MTFWLAIAVCLVMAVLSVAGKWEVNKYGLAALWVMIALQATMLYGLAESYRSVVMMLGR